MAPRWSIVLIGTSPRTRGKPEKIGCPTSSIRNIPAYAGKTSLRRPGSSVRQEHPRVCGENSAWVPSQGFSQRNIPAYAGKTSRLAPISIQLPEHPRVCGENAPRRQVYLEPPGTSPRMRGKQLDDGTHCRTTRNIPAYAGKTYRIRSRLCLRREHPRVCGENLKPRVLASLTIGTSPRTRGKPV